MNNIFVGERLAALQTATFRSHQGHISLPVSAILNGQFGRSAEQRVFHPADLY